MADMVLSVAGALVSTIKECKRLCEQKKLNVALAEELNRLLRTLQDNNAVLQKKTMEGAAHHSNTTSLALDALRLDMESAELDAKIIQSFGFRKSYWTADLTQAKLQSLRERVIISFHTRILFATLDVAIENKEELASFQSTMLKMNKELVELYNNNSNTAKKNIQSVFQKELKQLLTPVILVIKSQGMRIEAALSMMRSSSGQSSELQKFYVDVLEGLKDVTPEQCSNMKIADSGSKERSQSSDLYRWYEDPIQYETMCDPVKTTDGITYDRWTLLENPSSMARSPLMPEKKGPLLILVDDMDVQKWLFHEFPEQIEKCKSKRAAYREAALQAAHTGRLGDAFVMLSHVLQWSPYDVDCRIELDQVQHAMIYDCCTITTGARTCCNEHSKKTMSADDEYDIVDGKEYPREKSARLKPLWKIRQAGGDPSLVSISDLAVVFKFPEGVDLTNLGTPGIQLLYVDVPDSCLGDNVYFFESKITMEPQGSCVDLAVGFSTKEIDIGISTSCAHDQTPLLGTLPGSCGYYPMQGIILFYDKDKGQTTSISCERCRVGDYVGVGFHKIRQTLFFAHRPRGSDRGEVVMSVAANVIDHIHDQVFYAISLQSYGVGVQCNFDKFSLDEHKPKHLDRTTCDQSVLCLLPDGLSLTNVSNYKGRRPKFGSIMANAQVPILEPYFYFEVRIEKGEAPSEFAAVALGFTGTDTFHNICSMLGWSNSCAYNGINGELLQNEQKGIPFGPAIIEGDYLGAGINFRSSEIFFVLNGVLIGAVQNCLRGTVKPFVGLGYPNIKVRASFGDDFGGKEKIKASLETGCNTWRLINNPLALSLVELSGDGLTVQYKVSTLPDDDLVKELCSPACLRANRIVFSEGLLYKALPKKLDRSMSDTRQFRFFFELTVKKQSAGDNIAIGFCEQNHFRGDMMPGCFPHSIGYHSHKGELFTGTSQGQKFAPASSQGDTIGAAFFYHENAIAFYNGKTWSRVIKWKRKRLSCTLYPVIGLQGADMEVQLKFKL